MAITMSASRAVAPVVARKAAVRVGGARISARKQFSGVAVSSATRIAAPSRTSSVVVQAIRDGAKLDRKLRVLVVGGGPSGAVAADDLAKGGVEVIMIERKMDNCKVCARHETHIIICTARLPQKSSLIRICIVIIFSRSHLQPSRLGVLL